MKPECPKFEPQQAQERLLRFGWVSIPIDTPKAVVDEFAAQHGLSVEKHFFNWMLKPLETVAETPEEKAAKFEKIRQENMARRSKLAANRKKKARTI